MLSQNIKELARLKTTVAKLEAQIADALPDALASLPEEYDYADLKSFIKALKKAAGKKPKGKPGRKAKAPKIKKVNAGKRKRAKITDEIRAQVKAAFEAGKKGAAIAKEVGISLPSVSVLKKAMGFVKAKGGAVLVAQDPTVAATT